MPPELFHTMILGLDFDNTIVSYNEVFHLVAIERGLIPPGLASTKVAVRRHLLEQGLEPLWTELQGEVYGTRMRDALPFPGAPEFVREATDRGVGLFIISHKTRYPYAGPRHDLHRAALDWLDFHGFFDRTRVGLGRDRVFFELTKEAKLGRIAATSCSHFVDDLPEVLESRDFPDGVERILFDPSGFVPMSLPLPRLVSWRHAWPMLEATRQPPA